MIRFRLNCDNGHDFDAWFGSGAAYDRQAELGLLSCAVCGSAHVDKAIMAPSLRSVASLRTDTDTDTTIVAAIPEAPSLPDIPARVAASMPPEILVKLREIRAHVRKHAEYVGPRFAEEARKIHHEETASRGIYGEATRADVEALLDEGIDIAPLPMLPEDRN